MSSSCKKDSSKPCLNITPFSFNVASNIAPESETYKMGDTLFLNSKIPFAISNNMTNEQVNYENNTGISGSLTFAYFDTSAHLLKASFDKFQIVPYIGNYTPINNTPNNGINCSFVEENRNFQFKIGIIPKQKGIYSLAFNDLSSRGLKNKDCTNANFIMTITNSNKNFNLFQYGLGYPPDAYLQQHIYCFRVI